VVAPLGALALLAVGTAVVLGKHEPLVTALVLLGTAYAAILAIDEPPLDGRSAIVGAIMLAIGELGYLSLGARSAVIEDVGDVARRIAAITIMTLVALGIGATVLVVVDVFRAGGIVIDAAGVVAAAAAIGLLVLAARGARSAAR
jgi:hypothetical protein